MSRTRCPSAEVLLGRLQSVLEATERMSVNLTPALQKKPKKSTISEVDRKVDSLINIVKKRKIEE